MIRHPTTITLASAVLAALIVCPQSLPAEDVPSDNPVAAFYSGDQGYPAWTDRIRWDNVINMAAYGKGETDFAKFENARDQLADQGDGKSSYIGGRDVNMAGALFGWNKTAGWIGSNNVGKREAVDASFVGNQCSQLKPMAGSQAMRTIPPSGSIFWRRPVGGWSTGSSR